MRICKLTSAVIVLSAVALTALAADKKPDAPKAGATLPAFEKFKALAGEWTGKEVSGKATEGGMEVHVKYKVSSGGSAVVETIFPGTEHEMVTVIHPDGDNLLLTHYCMLGNQPHMKTDGKSDSKTIAFEFVKATNMKSDKDMHMHDATFTFVDNDTLKTEWTHYMDGKSAGKVVFEMKRKK
jgi:hypothetical protein